MQSFNKLTVIISGVLPALTLLVLQALDAGTFAMTGAQQWHLIKAGVLAALVAAVLDHGILRVAALRKEPLAQTLVRCGASISCAGLAYYGLS